MDSLVKAVPCDSIIGFVIYNLPGRDCSSGASGGEFQVGELDRYKSEFIDRKLLETSLKTSANIINPQLSEQSFMLIQIPLLRYLLSRTRYLT
jgi:cellulase/cellobiase CelA1